MPGRKRKGSLSNPDAGITDRVYRDAATRDFFATNVAHAKGTLEGKPDSDVYQSFLDQGAPFIGGASGTMHGLVVGIELDKQKRIDAGEEVDGDPEEKRKRETLIGVYMATLVAGGHHSVSECLIAAKGYGYFDDITHPLYDYPRAMDELGIRLQQLGLAGKLKAEAPIGPGDPWREAFEQTWKSFLTLQEAISAAYRRRELDPGPLIRDFRNSVGERIKALFPDDLANKLDEMAAEQDDDARGQRVNEARDMIKQLQANLKDGLLRDLDTNPFNPLNIRETMSGTLERLSKGVVGKAPAVSSEPSGP